ncbi:MAG TPA: DNA recombination protein RmuC [Polyangiales bacterium]|nr:DNA recombination protein RmuC [Polyangiales bacterium]
MLDSQLTAVRAERDTATKQWNDERAQGEAKLEALRREARQEAAQLREAKEATERNLAALASTLQGAQIKAEHVARSADEHRASLGRVEDELKAMAAAQGQLREQNAAREQELVSLRRVEAELLELRRENEGLRTQDKASGERVATVEAKLVRLDAVQRDLAESITAHDTLRTQLASAREQQASLSQQLNELQKRERELQGLRAEPAALNQQLVERSERVVAVEAQLDLERKSTDDKLRMQRDLHAELEAKFSGLAAQVLERNSEKFEVQTKTRLNEMTEALGKQVKELQLKVEQTHSQDAQDRVALRTELQNMVEASRRIDEDAVNLTRALTMDRKAQGAWGELVLERILEQCGLREGTEYEKQVVLTNDDDQKLRPDVVVRLPGNRSVVVDAKVSLVAYNESVCAKDEWTAQEALARHVASIRNHVRGLSEKDYWRLNGLDTGDYVLMFLPIESAFADAVRAAPDLFEEAFRNQIILTSPTTLLATLRTIEHTWRVERQNATARTIVEQAGKLYDKLAGFVVDLEKVGASLNAAQRSYEGALNKFSTGKGNLVGQADRLKQLGLKLKKTLPAELVDQARIGEVALPGENDNDAADATPDEIDAA